MENSISKSLSILLVIVFIASAVALAGSQNSAIYRGIPVFAICAFVAFLINWLVYIPSNLKYPRDAFMSYERTTEISKRIMRSLFIVKYGHIFT